MSAFKVKKGAWLRRRFVMGPILTTGQDLESWVDGERSLRQKILTGTAFQIVGDKSILSMNSQTGHCQILVEVLGIPKNEWPTMDKEPCEVLFYECPESLFDVDFLTLKTRAQALISVISHRLEDHYHIVSDGKNLTLHFFIQKDYIHS